MPHITVRYDAYHVRANNYLTKPIAEIVANELTCDDAGGSITSDDIEVELQPFGEMDKTNGMTITVQITADEFPSRKANLQERTDKIARAMQDLFRKSGVILTPDVSVRRAFVWVLLTPAGFTKFEI